MSVLQNLKPTLTSILNICQKYIDSLDSTQNCVKSLQNLCEQLQATESIRPSHPLPRQQPDVIHRLTACIHDSIVEQITDLQSAMANIESVQKQSQKCYNKHKQRVREIKSYNIVELNSRTEQLPSVADILLWIETIHTLITEDYAGRALLISGLICVDSKSMVQLCGRWGDGKTLEVCQQDIRAFSQYFLDN